MVYFNKKPHLEVTQVADVELEPDVQLEGDFPSATSYRTPYYHRTSGAAELAVFEFQPAISLCLFILLLHPLAALHLQGSWKPSQRYRFLTKFGFQRTQVDELEATRGYVYGSVKLSEEQAGANVSNLATLVLVDSEFILDLYGNATEPVWLQNTSGITRDQLAWMVENERCRRMFSKIDAIAWHKTCAPNGQLDLIRAVPCSAGKFCAEEDNSARVITNSQFTYTVQDLRQPRYWYLMLVACSRNPQTCQWVTTALPNPDTPSSSIISTASLDYSIWLVNGAPRLQGFNKFEHQFSFEKHDSVEIYLVFFVLYAILGTIVHVKMFRQSVIHGALFLTHVWLSIFATLFTTIHLGVFSFDGQGLGHLSTFGTLIAQWADALFLVLLLSTAEMGFFPTVTQRNRHTVEFDTFVGPGGSPSKGAHGYVYHRLPEYTQAGIESKNVRTNPMQNEQSYTSPWPFIFLMVALFESVQTILYIWASIDQNPVIDFYIWNTVPGCLLLAVRFGVSFWFLAILRRRLLQVEVQPNGEEVAGASSFGLGIDLVHFAAGFLLWMVVLPLVVFIAETSVSPLWRSKTILSVCLSANYVAACVYAYLLITCRKNRSVVAPFRRQTAMPRLGDTRAGILSGYPSLDRGRREAEVGFEPRTFRSVNSCSNHFGHLAPSLLPRENIVWPERKLQSRCYGIGLGPILSPFDPRILLPGSLLTVC
ncbi:hypothetical protein T265_04018 [Opisthorchis viverrini]|uniref:GPR180/TMEM145 transmembrane domain-containing protein n=1 Tax=Opisthorchis viverrini TaxID=6198 RepID=A0A075A1D0_OPIVI|nr:hypothetical protein T265_04018 [Opisthorchis viverrini]KER29365.1 hypothetical protein T265_04018 [Opisthorchis viverrini]